MQLDERASRYGVTFLDDTTDETYFTGMRGVHALLDAFTTDGWFEPAGPEDETGTDFAGMKSAPEPVVAENGGKLHYVHIRAKNPSPETPAMVMLTGFTEMAEHMREMAYYFWQAGYSIYILEHRGHGRSPRDVEDLGLIWIDDFRRYVADVEKLIRTVVRPASTDVSAGATSAPVHVYAHSMGGGVALALAEHLAEHSAERALVDAYVLTAPMVAPRSTLSDGLTRLIANLGAFFASKKRIFIQKNQTEFNRVFDENYARGLNHGRALWLHEQRCAVETNQMYAASYGWMKAAGKLTDYILQNAGKITVPVLLFQAPNDAWVSVEKQNELAERAGAPVRKVVLEHSRHEMEAEQTQTVHEMMDTALEFLLGKPEK
ncbi:alpha/beta hydrolase [Alloscardovia macacae]|nr:alpha/beta hydrolase [Alloscardovia macacae]